MRVTFVQFQDKFWVKVPGFAAKENCRDDMCEMELLPNLQLLKLHNPNMPKRFDGDGAKPWGKQDTCYVPMCHIAYVELADDVKPAQPVKVPTVDAAREAKGHAPVKQ